MSTTAAGLPPNVATYLAALRVELSDLAPDERDDLLAEVEPSLLEAAADGDEPIAGRLGAPADFAADLRASAGLPPRPSARPSGTLQRLRELAASPALRKARHTARELAPAWWAARAYFAVGLLALVLGIDWSAQHPVLPRFGSTAGTALVLALVLAGSFALGLRMRGATHRGARRALIALNAVLLVAAVPILDRATDAPAAVVHTDFAPAPTGAGLVYDDVTVENVYPYDRKGRLLHDVRLYDQLGRPLEALSPGGDPARRHVRERNGERAFNAYPIRYFEPGTRRVARPNAGPDVDPRPLRTPPPR